MSLTLQGPPEKERSDSVIQRMSSRSHKKETKTGLGIDSDADSFVYSSEAEDDEDLVLLDPEKKKLAEITESHREIIALCKKTKDSKQKKRPNFAKGGQAEGFKVRYKDTLDASGDDEKTLLHHLAKSMTSSLLPLLRWLLETYPDLILKTDSEDHTASYTAIASQNASFITWVCDHSDNKVKALQQTGVDGTCLHKALELRSSEPRFMEVLDRMIHELGDQKDAQTQANGEENSPLRNVLRERDKEGNTPLHIALTTLASCKLSDNSFSLLVALAIALIKDHPKIMYERNNKSKSPYDCLGPAKEMEACGVLLEEMKKGIMRELSHDEVINLLYADSGSGK